MSVDPQKAKAVFLDAVEHHAPAQWTGYLQEACGDDIELRQWVEELLVAHRGEDSLLDRVSVPTPATLDQPITEKPGTVIGPYKLLQEIGEGGMGVVYMAEQTEPVERRVALKIIKPGMDTRQVIARFEAEEQALAMMDHPNIAKVFDAGATESGRPYFVMELVRGIPITTYCDQQHLSPKERLQLFIPVCQAVQHAHQKGIIHRDLKPSNILIALYDGQPVPKVIDFGVAKATGARLTEKTMFTQFGQVVGTLEYMSPEQANLNQLDIDTRSDIYSLGVLLYELLTGCTPFDRERLRSAAFDEMMRIIREEEPPRPSLRISTLGDTLPSVAAHRKVEPKKLATIVRTELDWVVMKALDKDRTRRYETANGLASDICRYLQDERVEACPPSAVYRFKKFARKNRAVITTAAVVAVALLAGIGIATSQAIRAMRAEHLARDRLVAEQAARTVAEQARAGEAKQRARAEAHLEQATAEHKQAMENLELAMTTLTAVYLEALGDDTPLAGLASRDGFAKLQPNGAIHGVIHAQILLLGNRTEEYRLACAEVVARFGQSLDSGESCHAARACVLAPRAIADPMIAVELAEKAVEANPTGVYPRQWMLYTLGMAYFRAGKLDEAANCFRESLELDPEWHAVALNWLGLALVEQDRGESEEARRWHAKAVDLMEHHPAIFVQDRIEARLLRREVEQLFGEPKQEKQNSESESEE